MSQIGAPYTLAGMAAAMYLVSRATGDKKARETGFLGAIAIAHSQIVTQGLKLASQRFVLSNTGKKTTGERVSFRAAIPFHPAMRRARLRLRQCSLTNTAGTTMGPYTAYGLASLVSASRLSAQEHWVSDIFVGGTMGFLVGRFVYKSHHNPALDELRLSERNDWSHRWASALAD